MSKDNPAMVRTYFGDNLADNQCGWCGAVGGDPVCRDECPVRLHGRLKELEERVLEARKESTIATDHVANHAESRIDFLADRVSLVEHDLDSRIRAMRIGRGKDVPTPKDDGGQECRVCGGSGANGLCYCQECNPQSVHDIENTPSTIEDRVRGELTGFVHAGNRELTPDDIDRIITALKAANVLQESDEKRAERLGKAFQSGRECERNMMSAPTPDSEQLRTQLAGCSCAALGATKDTAKKGDYGWSPAYQDVLELRLELEALRKPTPDSDEVAECLEGSWPGPDGGIRISSSMAKNMVSALPRRLFHTPPPTDEQTMADARERLMAFPVVGIKPLADDEVSRILHRLYSLLTRSHPKAPWPTARGFDALIQANCEGSEHAGIDCTPWQQGANWAYRILSTHTPPKAEFPKGADHNATNKDD